jgi:hypothetical protein
MYVLVFAKPGPDFSRGCTVERIGLSLFATHPHHAAIREVTLGDTPWLPHRSGFMQVRSCGLSRMYLPRRLVNKLAVDAPESTGWHHAHGVDPVEKGELAW